MTAALLAARSPSTANPARSLRVPCGLPTAHAVHGFFLMEHADVVERSAALLSVVDGADRVLILNGRCEEACDVARDCARGRSWLEMFVPPEERGEVARRFASVRRGETAAPFTASIAAGGKPRRIRWEFTLVAPDNVCATGMDIREDEEAAVRSRRAERIAALGTMTAGLAHELRNPLNAAHLQLDLARRRLIKDGGGNGALDALDVASAEVSRLAHLVDEFLLFARPDPLRLEPGDLRAVALSTAESVRDDASARSIELVLEVGEPAPAEFDDKRITQAVEHLLRNAIEAAGDGGRVRVAVSAGERLATIAVEDSGAGLPADAPVFEPFYTTKPTGTGLGLAIAHRIACDHGGSITVDSSPGHTRFTLSVPGP